MLRSKSVLKVQEPDNSDNPFAKEFQTGTAAILKACQRTPDSLWHGTCAHQYILTDRSQMSPNAFSF